MENIVNLIDRLEIDQNLLTFCKVQLLSFEDLLSLKTNTDWRLKLKINIEYDLAYDKLYIGQWNEVPEEHRRMFIVLSFLKAFCVVRNHENHNLEQLLKALKIVDVGIVTGSGLEECQLLTEFAQLLHDFLGKFLVQNLVK